MFDGDLLIHAAEMVQCSLMKKGGLPLLMYGCAPRESSHGDARWWPSQPHADASPWFLKTLVGFLGKMAGGPTDGRHVACHPPLVRLVCSSVGVYMYPIYTLSHAGSFLPSWLEGCISLMGVVTSSFVSCHVLVFNSQPFG